MRKLKSVDSSVQNRFMFTVAWSVRGKWAKSRVFWSAIWFIQKQVRFLKTLMLLTLSPLETYNFLLSFIKEEIYVYSETMMYMICTFKQWWLWLKNWGVPVGLDGIKLCIIWIENVQVSSPPNNTQGCLLYTSALHCSMCPMNRQIPLGTCRTTSTINFMICWIFLWHSSC